MSILLLCIAFLFGISIGVSVTLTINNNNSNNNNNNSIITNTPCECERQPKNQVTTPTLSLFNEMHSHLSVLANKPVEISRKQYHAGAVPVSPGGGLDDSDRDLLARIYFNASSVFEFGLGESTHIAAYVGVPRYSGVDNEVVWVGKARDGAKLDHFRFSFSDTGKTSMHSSVV